MSELSGVRCTIDSCAFWSQGDRCHAQEILITSDAVGRRAGSATTSQQINSIVETEGQTPVQTCVETCCKTFEPRS